MTPSLWQILGLVMISSGLFLVYKEQEIVYDQR
jgi:drug/metabolite transporter (DMT)-like permease